MPISDRPVSIAQRLLPVLNWLPGYRRDWLLPDALAGLAVWAVVVPEGMAYAGIIGVPPIMGLFCVCRIAESTTYEGSPRFVNGAA